MPSDWSNRLAAHVLSVTTPAAVLGIALEHMQRIFAAPIGMILHARPDGSLSQSVHGGLRELHFREYMRSWSVHDPVRRLALAQRAAVRDLDVACRATGTAFSAGFVGRLGADAYVVAPLYGSDGGIGGTLHMWRYRGASGFTTADAVQATVFAAFLSVLLARTPALPGPGLRLAPREYQVALLAASGHSNKDIACQLGVATETVKQTLRRVYRKVNVGGRTELAAHCARSGLL